MNSNTPPTCNPSPIIAVAARDGSLAHWSSTCTCGLEIASTIRTSVDADIREHLAYMDAKRARQLRASGASLYEAAITVRRTKEWLRERGIR